MSGIQEQLLGGPFGPAPAYQIQRSLRFNSADSAYLNRTPASAGNRKTWTWSGWVKFSAITGQAIISNTDGSNENGFSLEFTSGGIWSVYDYTSSTVWIKRPSNLLRDLSAWYHLVLAFDTTQATAGNRVKMYINGEGVTSFSSSTDPTLNYDGLFNTTAFTAIGRYGSNNGGYFSGYLTDINFIDGQALTPSSFGQTNSATGVWEPIAYTGTYGTNGFYLNFSDNSNTTSTTLGKDYSGNGNNWTPSAGFSVAAGAGNDSLVDTPTSYGTDTGVGGEVRGNYATLNPLRSKNSPTFSQGNMRVTDASSSFGVTITTIPPVAGDKIYGEATVASNTSGSSVIGFGFTDVASGATLPDPGNANAYMFYGNANGNIYNGTSLVTSGLGAPTAGTVLQVAYDKSNGYAWVGKANTWYDSSGGTTGNPAAGTNPTFTLTSSNLNFYVLAYNNSLDINFGQRPFAHTAPSGFKALCTQNLPTPTIGATSATRADDYFNTVLYTGTGSSLSVTGVGFQPDFVWIKERSGAADHGLYDAVRGVQNQLESNTTDAATTESTGLTAFNTDGFTVGALAQLNTNTDTYVAWNWKANGAGSANTAGSISSTVSANTAAGFSIVTYTGTGANATVGHGCLVNSVATAPSMVIVKRRSAADAWYVYHKNLTSAAYALQLNSTIAETSLPTIFNSTAPTSTLFSIGTDSAVNANTATYVAYCFAPVAGYSAFGSYTGNGSTDGTFVYTGFRPEFVMVKNISATSYWQINDAARNPYNLANLALHPNVSDAEATYSNAVMDILSNGFKLRGNDTYTNTNGNIYIYAAFAEFPFKYTLAR